MRHCTAPRCRNCVAPDRAPHIPICWNDFIVLSVVRSPEAFPGTTGGWAMENAALILIAEDEDVIRDLLHAALEDDGYKLLMANSGEEAVKLLKKHKRAKALVTDIRLGSERKMTGWEVARQARELNPDIAVVYMSGDSAADWAVDGVPKSIMVTKPFAVSQISTALATLLNASG